MACILLAEFQANTNADTITPTTTATARSSATVTTVTRIITSASDFGTFVNSLNEFHAKVPITTINITPTNAAIGINSIKKDPYSMKKSKNKAAMDAESLDFPPDLTLIID